MNGTMRVVEIKAPGGAEMLVPALRDIPVPKPGEVLIEVAAAGVNRPDVMQRLGLYDPPKGESDIPGLEVAGRVVACGEGVEALAIGAMVCALVGGGGYGEFCTAPAAQCLPLPPNLTPVEAAGLPETVFTVWSCLFDIAALQAGETLLVHGGASGIGTTAIQLAKAFGARVAVTAGTDDKCARCTALGADLAINYKTEDFVSVIRERWGETVDVVLDMVGGDYVARNCKVLARGGRHVSIAILGGNKAAIDIFTIMRKTLILTGATLRSRKAAEKAAIAAAVGEHVWPLVAAGKIRPLIHATFPLAHAAEAHRLMESSAHTGKIILTMGQRPADSA
jgi:putative PIG3 family NAD(P)H quinone oxidoreductase